MGSRVNYSGLVVAGIGFVLTRFTVTLALYDDPVQFYVAGVIPLALGLGLAAFGVAMTVADVDASVVKTTALWCVVGTATMFVFAALTVLGAMAGDPMDLTAALSESYLSNFLIGGAIGGTLTGLYATRTRRQRRDLERNANRLVVLNRLLRHEVLNSITAIKGYASLEGSHDAKAAAVIDDRTEAIERTIDEVKHLTRHAGRRDRVAVPIDLAECLEASAEAVRRRHPDADLSVQDLPRDLAVRADGHVSKVFTHLLENAIVHADDPSPSIEVTASTPVVRVRISDTGPGLPADQQALLETGDVGDFDSPKTGFGLNIVRLFVDEFDGAIETDVSESGTAITVVLPRASQASDDLGPVRRAFGDVRLAIPHLVVSVGTALIAGLFYGAVSEALGGSIAGIGVFYGTADPLVGWLTHEFHSVVFGFAFVGFVSVASDWWETDTWTFVGVGLAWSLLLWAGAAGVVAPVWLRLLGVPAAIPNLSVALLVSHLVWGLSLGVLTAAGYRYAVPVLDRRL